MLDFDNFLKPMSISGSIKHFGIDHPEHWDYHWKHIKKTYKGAFYDDTKQPIVYNINKNGYRNKDLKDVDWNNFALFLGCSNTFGQGVPEKYLVSSLVESKLKIDCVNLGVPGGSNIIMSNIALEIARANLKPKFVVVGWTTHNRTYDFIDNKIENLGIWSVSWYSNNHVVSTEYFKNWMLNEERAMYQSMLAQKQIRQYFKDVKVLEHSYSKTIANDMKCHFVNNDKTSRARDGYHESHQWHDELAQWVLKNV